MVSNRVLGLGLSILMISATLTGCLGLAFQREFMESMREEPIVRNKEETVGFDYTFESNSIESVYHTDEIKIELKYYDGEPVIREINRVSRPGCRVYSKIKDLPKVYNGLGIAILSTPRGVMSDAEAREANVGGEILCQVF